MNPRESIEAAIAADLLGITQANGYTVARNVHAVTRRQIKVTDVPDELRPMLLLLTEENASEFIELSRLKETSLTVNVLLYETVRGGEEPVTVLNGYAQAIRRVLSRQHSWQGLADYIFTEIEGVAQHQILEDLLPTVMTTVAATVRYTHDDREIA
jgi:hypothetical protein